MSRKRLIKLLMARGWSRNSANSIAGGCNGQVSHCTAYIAASIIYRDMPQIIDAIADYIVEFSFRSNSIQKGSGHDNN